MSIRLSRIKKALEQWFQSSAVVDELSHVILNLPFKWQDYVLNQILAISKTSPEIAYRFALGSEQALNLLDKSGTEKWLQRSIDIHLSDQPEKALSIITNLEHYIAELQTKPKGLSFDDIRFVLQHFIYGLDGRHLKIRTGQDIFTDSDTIFLPEVVEFSDNNEVNFNLYKALAVHQWSQCWYGTWQVNQYQELLSKPQLIVPFHRLETERLNACIERDYPGLAIQLSFFGNMPASEQWLKASAALKLPTSDISTTFNVLQHIDLKKVPSAYPYQGQLKPDHVKVIQDARIKKEKSLLLDNLTQSLEQQPPAAKNNPPFDSSDIENRQLSEIEDNSPLSTLDFNIATLPTDENLENLLVSIKQDFGEIPSSYSISAGSGDYAANLKATKWRPDADVENKDQNEEAEPTYYDEWDCTRQAHRKHWCALYEQPVSPDFDTSFVAETLDKYRGNIRTISRSFEALRDEYTILNRQPDGDRLDLDAMVEAMSDVRTGKEMSSRLYRKSMRQERNIAVIFMVDMSGSTKGWINTAQREALILLSEALQALDDRYAIYGFSSKTRKRCELYPIKRFEDQYDETVQARIAAIEPHHYTRMGVTIRHLTQLLDKTRARRKLLITLSDGKPDDYDSYHGEYGIEDTRMALLEAKSKSIHSFCITIDEKAREYLPHMYGTSNYILIDDVEKLPYRLSDVYRGLTS